MHALKHENKLETTKLGDCGFLRTRILPYKDRIVDSVLIPENKGL